MKIYSNFARLKQFFRWVGIRPWTLLVPTVLALGAAFFEGLSFGLLIPTIKGIIEGNTRFVKTLPLLNRFVALLPYEYEGRNAAIFTLLIGLIFVSAVAKNVFQYLSMVGVAYQAKEFCNKLRKLIYERYLSFGKLFFDQNNIGHLHQVLT